MACGPTCIAPTPAQAHCSAEGCHRTFYSVRGFDDHRKGDRCVDPAMIGMEADDRGRWRTPITEEARARLAANRAQR